MGKFESLCICEKLDRNPTPDIGLKKGHNVSEKAQVAKAKKCLAKKQITFFKHNYISVNNFI